MSGSFTAPTATDQFEFSALTEAKNYRGALLTEFGPTLRGDLIEVGAGIGQMTEHLVQLPEVRHATAIEPDPALCVQFRTRLPNHTLLQGTVADLPAGSACDAIL